MGREAVKPGGGHGVAGSNEGGWAKLQAQDCGQKERHVSGGEQISPGSAGNTCGRFEGEGRASGFSVQFFF